MFPVPSLFNAYLSTKPPYPSVSLSDTPEFRLSTRDQYCSVLKSDFVCDRGSRPGLWGTLACSCSRIWRSRDLSHLKLFIIIFEAVQLYGKWLSEHKIMNYMLVKVSLVRCFIKMWSTTKVTYTVKESDGEDMWDRFWNLQITVVYDHRGCPGCDPWVTSVVTVSFLIMVDDRVNEN